MRNLKRVLALALAVVMMIGMMVTASAATYADKADIDAKYTAAVNVTSDMGIFKGQGNGFAPKATLTRAEAAAIIYRVMTQDVTDAKIGLYDYASLKDIPAGQWYTGYVTYANNGGYVKGDGTNFYPYEKVTGTQFLAMLLRAMGYGQNGEYEGTAWKDYVLTDATDLGLVKNVTVTSLDIPATREIVAQMLFDALQVTTTYYTPALGYIPTGTTLGAKFSLAKAATADEWGRPGTKWSYTVSGVAASTTVLDTAKVTYTAPVAECQVYTDAGLKADKTYTLYVNGENVGNYTINAIDTVTKIGVQGRLTEVYSDRIVMIDTFLAKVDTVIPATFDAAGHLTTPATIKLDIYDVATIDDYTMTNGKTNYTYAKNDYVLVSVYTETGTTGGYTYANTATSAGLVDTTATTKYGEIQGLATSMVGAQTVLWYNVEQHTVNGTTYNDAYHFILDEAGVETTNHSWYFDAYGNLIGAVNIATQYTYGVISALWWVNDGTNGTGRAVANLTYMDGTTASVTLSLLDDDGLNTANAGYKPVAGHDANAMSERVAPTTTVSGEIVVATNAYVNATSSANQTDGSIGGHMFQFETRADGTVAAYKIINEVTDATVSKGMSAITGTNGPVYTNSETVYLVKTTVNGVDTYTSVAGFNNISGYTDATVDYVKIPANSTYAKYVFLYGTSTAANSSNYVWTQGNNYSATLKKLGGVDYYEFTYGLNMDGTVSTLKVPVDNSVIGGTTYTGYTDVIVELTANVGKLYKITYANGFAVDATLVSTTGVTAGQGNMYTAVYLGTDVTATADALYNTSGTLGDADNNTHYNVTSTTVVLGGSLADLATAGKGVYVIYKTVDSNTVTHIYIVSASASPVRDLRPINAVTLTPGTITAGTTAPSAVTWTINYNGYGTSTNTTDQASLKVASVTWEKLDSNGMFQTWNGDIFVAGTYRYTATMAIDNADADGDGFNGCYLPVAAQTVQAVVTLAP